MRPIKKKKKRCNSYDSNNTFKINGLNNLIRIRQTGLKRIQIDTVKRKHFKLKDTNIK